MKRILLTISILIPFLGFSQLWDFASSNQDWTKKGSGQYTVATYGTTADNLHLTVTGTNTSNNFLVLENLVQSINTPTTDFKFLRVKLANNSVVETMTFRADATNPSGANKSVTIVPNSTSNTEYFIDLTGITWGSGAAGTYELRFQKPGTSSWGTSQYIAIDEIEFMTDIVKNDHIFDDADNWVGETNASNGTTVSVTGGKIIVASTGAINAKIKNDFYSIDGANKYIHILYKNNSTVNNSLRVNYFSPTDSYASQKSFPNEYITVDASDSELIIDANAVADWTGYVRRISLVLSNYDGTSELPANVDTNTLEIERIVVNNSNTPLSSSSFETNNIFIYPNPVKDYLSINSDIEIDSVEIYNLSGQLISKNSISKNIQTTNLSFGVYIVKVFSLDNVLEFKFIKE
jgi:hypothetical protein